MGKKIEWKWDEKEKPIKLKKGEKPAGIFHTGRRNFRDRGKLVLWKRLIDAGVSYRDLATAAAVKGLFLQSISNLANHGVFPTVQTRRYYRDRIEAGLRSMEISTGGIWNPLPPAQDCDGHECLSTKAKVRKKRKEVVVRKEKILRSTLKHFKLFKDPFDRQFESVENIYVSPEFRSAEDVLLDAAHHGEFVALCGPSGSGKTTLLKKIIETLRAEEKVTVVQPKSFQKERLSVSAVCDAIVRTLSPSAKLKGSLEGKAWQVEGLLRKLHKSGMRTVLIIDEGHALTASMLRYLKRFHEIEEGFVKLLGIILVGQEELDETLDEYTHHEIREVIKRCQKVRIEGLNGSVADYLGHRFAVIGADISKVFTPEALDAIGQRDPATTPLDINNLGAAVMNTAASLQEPVVTEEIVWHVRG